MQLNMGTLDVELLSSPAKQSDKIEYLPPTPPTPSHRGLTIRIRDVLTQHHCLPADGVVTVVTARKTGGTTWGRYEKAQCRYCRALISLDDSYPPTMNG